MLNIKKCFNEKIVCLNMLLSIIIPTYNEQENLSKRLSFLHNKTNEFPIEILVANSPQSSDDSKSICKKFENVTYFDCCTKGRAQQMNFAAKEAKGEVLLFLHADVILPENFYNEILNVVKNGKKAGFFAYEFDKESPLLKFNSRFTKKDGLFAGGGDQCQFFTKDTFDKLGGYNEDFCIMEDFEMIDRVRKQNIPFEIIQSKAKVSARKYEKNSWLKVNLINGIVFLKYKLGYTPENLRKTYKSLLREGV